LKTKPIGVFVCNRASCKRYYNWEYFTTVGDGFVVQNQKLEIFRWSNNNQTILPSYSKYFFQRGVLNI